MMTRPMPLTNEMNDAAATYDDRDDDEIQDELDESEEC